MIDALERGVADARRKAEDPPPSQPAPTINTFKRRARPSGPVSVVHPRRVRYPAEEDPAKLCELQHQIYLRRVPVVIAYEGWDAGGKGGNIRRLTQNLDPRGHEVVPIAAPNDIEKAHHYLWRFWAQLPKAGHITIFDRTWYGRVPAQAGWKRLHGGSVAAAGPGRSMGWSSNWCTSGWSS